MFLWCIKAQVSNSHSMRQRSGTQNQSPNRDIRGGTLLRKPLIHIAEPEVVFLEVPDPITFFPILPSIPATRHKDLYLPTTTTPSLQSIAFTIISRPEDTTPPYPRRSPRGSSKPTSTAFTHCGRSYTNPSMRHSTMLPLRT
jgi:hypothetical protein